MCLVGYKVQRVVVPVFLVIDDLMFQLQLIRDFFYWVLGIGYYAHHFGKIVESLVIETT